MPSRLAACHALIYGRVQGVYYRAFVERWARQLGLAGFVRNLRDRSVEAHLEGPRDRLEKMLAEMRLGPPGARVDDIKLEWLDYSGAYDGFRVTG